MFSIQADEHEPCIWSTAASWPYKSLRVCTRVVNRTLKRTNTKTSQLLHYEEATMICDCLWDWAKQKPWYVFCIQGTCSNGLKSWITCCVTSTLNSTQLSRLAGHYTHNIMFIFDSWICLCATCPCATHDFSVVLNTIVVPVEVITWAPLSLTKLSQGTSLSDFLFGIMIKIDCLSHPCEEADPLLTSYLHWEE